MQSLLPNSYVELLEQVGDYSHFPKPGADELLHIGFRAASFNAQAPIF